jgi:hypothetical protein
LPFKCNLQRYTVADVGAADDLVDFTKLGDGDEEESAAAAGLGAGVSASSSSSPGLGSLSPGVVAGRVHSARFAELLDEWWGSAG